MMNKESKSRQASTKAKKPNQLPLMSKFISQEISRKLAMACKIMISRRYKICLFLNMVMLYEEARRKIVKDI